MKKIVLFIVGICASAFSISLSGNAEKSENLTEKKTLLVYCTPELSELSTAWVNQFALQNPEMELELVSVNDPVSQMQSSSDPGMAIIPGGVGMTETSQLPVNIIIGRNVLVPVISVNNTSIETIQATGINPALFKSALSSSEPITWGKLLPNGGKETVQFFCTPEANKTSAFQKLKANNYLPIPKTEKGNIAEVLKNNPNAVVLCRLSEIIDAESYTFTEDFQLLPFDRNANNKIDYMEDFYAHAGDFTRAVWVGKYPKEFCDALFLVSNQKPDDNTQLAIAQWILTHGQQQLTEQGFSRLRASETQTGLAMLSGKEINTSTTEASGRSSLAFILLALAIILVFGTLVGFAFKRKGSIDPRIDEAGVSYSGSITESSITIPKGLLYDKTHTWLFREKDGQVRLGIDNFFQHLTGPLTRVDLKNPGEVVKKGEAMFTIARDGKRLTIYAPVSGTITSINENLTNNPNAIHSNPFSEGWVYLIDPLNWIREMQFLKFAETYQQWIKVEFVRLKDFLTNVLKPSQFEGAIALQDGGMIKNGVLSELEPRIWEEFQNKFINMSK